MAVVRDDPAAVDAYLAALPDGDVELVVRERLAENRARTR